MPNKYKKHIKKELLYKLVYSTDILNILELGAGNYSTPYIREYLKDKGLGFCLF
jgi:hypothetical protein